MPSRWRAAHLWVTHQILGHQRDSDAGNGQRDRKHPEQKVRMQAMDPVEGDLGMRQSGRSSVVRFRLFEADLQKR
jgi:hypothetical protein